VSSDGASQVFACGSNEFGQLGVKNRSWKNTLCRVEFQSQCKNSDGTLDHSNLKFSSVSAGDVHTIFFTDDGRVWTCGKHAHGQNNRLQLSNGDPCDLGQLLFWPGLDSIPIIKFISAGGFHSMFADNTGTVFTCGEGFNGCLGHGASQSKQYPNFIVAMKKQNIVAVAAGRRHRLLTQILNLTLTENLTQNQTSKTDPDPKPKFPKLPNPKFPNPNPHWRHSLLCNSAGEVFSCGHSIQGAVDDLSIGGKISGDADPHLGLGRTSRICDAARFSPAIVSHLAR